ncbi:polyphosphoinositide phosphatase isoform X3 [Ischnura elegans]|uniref:polyphosphoinositide phosphatase isoform X3 n=1 Tax=Ischnura elegans TaxID=197161 RepID=UPI001ED870D0|nr:polyphosphoinositide phosphatase isoform X3 [Ischnura elegans]
MGPPKIITHPLISCIQKIAVYETKARFYLMGSNNTQTRFRILKIDRTDPKELVIIDDNYEYSKDQIKDLVKMIDVGNRPKPGQRGPTTALSPVVSAFGIVGFVRFLEGYYMIVVTKRRRVAMVGHHTIYKIVDTNMIYIPNDGVRQPHPDEQKYYRMFQSIDLSSNFYFSYSYDITHTLQSNMTFPRCLIGSGVDGNNDGAEEDGKSGGSTSEGNCHPSMFGYPEEVQEYGVRNNPNRKFVWNSYLLSQIEGRLHPDWILYIVHGFVGQSNVSVFGRPIYVTLIARRSNKFAGTRFLKRGANFDGDVANEVETEQMVHDSGLSSLVKSRFSSFVQMRGSVPAYWCQDVSKMVPKPAISFNVSDPFAETAGKHFNDVLRRYGSPIIVLNLVKKREKKRHESALSENLKASVDYLNQFLPPQHHIIYLSFDMARMNKKKEANVMAHLGKKAYKAVCKVGIFQSQPPWKRGGGRWETPGLRAPPGHHSTMASPLLQTGIVRVNCVDCLDRTNTAQFALGKCALGLQLCALGILDDGNLEFDTDCVRMLENLYEDHGDTLALQYGGSQLVHRIRTYRKTAPWTSQGNDIMTTLSRYYRNTFSDAEKQHTMNLFLGLFIPEEGKMPIWEQVTDYYLHFPQTYPKKKMGKLTQWWDRKMVDCLPRASDEVWKECAQVIKLGSWVGDDQVDAYLDYYRPHEFSVLSDDPAYKISHSVRDYMPHFTTNFSPFTVRVRPGRRREESSAGGERTKNPSLTGQSSTSSTNSSDDSRGASGASESSEEDDNGGRGVTATSVDNPPSSSSMQFCSSLLPMGHEYDLKEGEPSKANLMLYKRYSQFGRSTPLQMEMAGSSNQHPLLAGKFAADSSSFSTPKPKVEPDSVNIYRSYIKRGMMSDAPLSAQLQPQEKDLILYQRSLLSISPVRLSPKPVDTTPASKFGRFDVFDSDENNSDSSVKVVMTVSDSSDVEVITASNGPVECGNEERYDENELISIKISWKLQPVEKFQLRRHQKFKTLMDHFAKLEGVPLQKIVIYGGKDCTRLIEPFDTPDTVGVTVTDVLEGGVLTEGGESRATRVRGLAGQHIGDGITVRVQVEGVRSFPVMIGREQKMHVLMVKVAEQMEVDVSRVKLSLDGEAIAPDSNAKDLDLEEGDVLDLRLL